MPYIGNTIRAADDYRLIDDISSGFNGSETSFALQVAGSAPVPFPKSPQQVLISVNGVIQEPDPSGSSGFNLVGTNIVFSSAPTNGHAFFGIIYATADYLNAGGNFPAGSLGAPSITFIGDENTGLFRKSGGSVGFVSDATEIANFDSNGITISSGNIIIPDSIIHNGDTNTKIRFPATDTVSVETVGSEALRVDNSQRLLVGTTSARTVGGNTQKILQIETTDATAGIAITRNSATTTASMISFGKSRGTSNGTSTIVQNNDQLGRINFCGADGTDAVSEAAKIEAFVDGTPGSNDMPGRLVFSTTADGAASATERLRITSSGEVGIGETSPSHKLHISAAENSTIAYFDTPLGGRGLKINTFVSGSAASAGVEFEAPAGAAKSAFVFKGASEFMRIDPSGNVGVGTSTINTAQDKALSIFGTNGSELKLQATNFGGTAADGGAALTCTFGSFFITNNNANGKIHFQTKVSGQSTSEKMVLTQDGKLGIGLSSPAVNIHSHTGNATNYQAFTNTACGGSTGSDGLLIGIDSNANANIFNFENTYMNFGTNGSERMRIDNSGNVGIGTTSPSQKLEVAGQVRVSASNAATVAFSVGDTGTGFYNAGSNTIGFATQGTQKWNIDSAGGLRLNDNVAAKFGTGSDLLIYHDAIGSIIQNGTGPTIIRGSGSNIDLRNSNDEIMIRANGGGAVDIRHANSVRILTTSSGINFSGNNNSFNAGANAVNTTFTSAFGGAGATSVIRVKMNTSAVNGIQIQQAGSGTAVAGGNHAATFFNTENAKLRLGANNVEHFRIENNGDLKATDTSIGSLSDSRLKKNIVDFTYDLTKFKNLRPRIFDWINPELHLNQSQVRGFVAQEIETVDSTLVGDYTLYDETLTDKNPDLEIIKADDGTNIAKDSKLGTNDAMYISVIQQMLTKIETLETKVAALEAA